jgi:hypothetical protein
VADGKNRRELSGLLYAELRQNGLNSKVSPSYILSGKTKTFHEFPALKTKPEDLLLEVKDGKLYITNTGMPHNLPTAD